MTESGEQRRRILLLRGTAIALLLSSLAGVGWTQRMMDGSKSATGKIQETLYFSDGEWLRKLCLGYEGLIADIYWTRVVQFITGERGSMKKWILSSWGRCCESPRPWILIC